MRPKRFVAREHAARIWAERGDAEHRVDGLILQGAAVHATRGASMYLIVNRETSDRLIMVMSARRQEADGKSTFWT